ncbi:MAG: thiol-disulfide isomerase [Cenarchaeum symbiont of Oopsacas minuta]|nr:thiol-disulfide isomerase [Cenarchaeum symbiont of Oopsacas minuta]
MDEDFEAIKRIQMQELLRRRQRASEPLITELDAGNFGKFISVNKLVLVDFWAEWCGPCKSMHPIFETIAREDMRTRFARVNIDRAQSIASRYRVQSIPTFIIFKDGIQTDRITGAVGRSELTRIIDKYSTHESKRR